ncbi:putative zinc finger (hit type) family protein [Rosellinia necatrix]|uniref:Putative zinc finger (Hit type) family protein n=1 Tax=Rosellinia necatrix TaxID=77044 RepID=A0A1S7UKN2_ROSNE|nr:putative zinc finger (hit type) family protein [Rosellinia necatrix]
MPATRPPCIICNTVEGKYRCPRCDAFTCALKCSREHRDNHPVVEERLRPLNSADIAPAVQPPHSEQQPPAKLSDIVDTTEYKTLLRRYPDLEKYLWSIATATDPPKHNQGGTMPRKANQPWTQEVGMTKAVQLVQSIKASPGDVRDALREFSDLVCIFKARMQVHDDQLRKQRAQEDARIISSLLRDEKS